MNPDSESASGLGDHPAFKWWSGQRRPWGQPDLGWQAWFEGKVVSMGYVTFLTNTSIENARQDVADPAEPARQRRSIQREPEQPIESALAMWQQASDTV